MSWKLVPGSATALVVDFLAENRVLYSCTATLRAVLESMRLHDLHERLLQQQVESIAALVGELEAKRASRQLRFAWCHGLCKACQEISKQRTSEQSPDLPCVVALHSQTSAAPYMQSALSTLKERGLTRSTALQLCYQSRLPVWGEVFPDGRQRAWKRLRVMHALVTESSSRQYSAAMRMLAEYVGALMVLACRHPSLFHQRGDAEAELDQHVFRLIIDILSALLARGAPVARVLATTALREARTAYALGEKRRLAVVTNTLCREVASFGKANDALLDLFHSARRREEAPERVRTEVIFVVQVCDTSLQKQKIVRKHGGDVGYNNTIEIMDDWVLDYTIATTVTAAFSIETVTAGAMQQLQICTHYTGRVNWTGEEVDWDFYHMSLSMEGIEPEDFLTPKRMHLHLTPLANPQVAVCWEGSAAVQDSFGLWEDHALGH